MSVSTVNNHASTRSSRSSTIRCVALPLLYNVKCAIVSAFYSCLANVNFRSQVDSASNYEERIDGVPGDDASAGPTMTAEDVDEGEDDPFKALPQSNLTFAGSFVFGRSRREDPALNANTGASLLCM